MMRRFFLAPALVIAAAALSTGCDPCSATSSCGATAGARLAIEGQLVRATTGRGVDGVRVDVLRRGGVALAADSFSVVTAGGGFWHLDTPAQSSGTVVLDFRVHTPALPHPYTVAGRSINTTNRAGDATVLERWVIDPYSNYFVSLFLRPTNGAVASKTITFLRRSTTWLTGTTQTDSSATSTTDAKGSASLFPGLGFFTDTGNVVGDLSVSLGAPYGTSVDRGVALQPTYRYEEPPKVIRVGMGPSLSYVVAVFDRATGKAAPGVPFSATRMSGIPVVSNHVSGVTDADGYAHLGFSPAAAGTLDASMTLTPRVGSPVTIPLTMPTFDSDSGRVLRNVVIGAGLNYAVLVVDRATGRPAAGVPFTATKVSGIAVHPTTMSGVTSADGYAFTSFVPDATGSLVASFTFTPRVGPTVTQQFTMPTFESDPGRVLANVSVGSYMNYFGVVDAGGAPLANVSVRVHATAGVAVVPTDATTTTNASGVFQVAPIPQAVGNVTFDLTFTPPAPYKAFLVRNVVLSTMQQDFPFGAEIWAWDVTGPPGGPPGSVASYLQ